MANATTTNHQPPATSTRNNPHPPCSTVSAAVNAVAEALCSKACSKVSLEAPSRQPNKKGLSHQVAQSPIENPTQLVGVAKHSDRRPWTLDQSAGLTHAQRETATTPITWSKSRVQLPATSQEILRSRLRASLDPARPHLRVIRKNGEKHTCASRVGQEVCGEVVGAEAGTPSSPKYSRSYRER